jgi:RHS repeat-associated protein
MKADGSVARHDYLPFGEEIPSSIGGRGSVAGYSTVDSTRLKFTQKERDSESGLDYFGARYCSSAQGRFTSVDPGGFSGRTFESPQDWNRYAYTINNPLKFIDPDGAERLQVIVQTFIPMRTVAAPGRALLNNRYFEGDHRNAGEPGGFRTQQIITIETDPRKNGGNPQLGQINRDTGITRELSSPNGEEIDKGRATGETLGGEVSRDESGVVNIHVHGNESDPLVTGAPGITYNFDIKVQSDGTQGNATITVSGEHDKFPAYEIIVSRPELPKTGSTVVYQHDPREKNTTPWTLFPIAPHIHIKPPKTTIIRPDGSVEE